MKRTKIGKGDKGRGAFEQRQTLRKVESDKAKNRFSRFRTRCHNDLLLYSCGGEMGQKPCSQLESGDSECKWHFREVLIMKGREEEKAKGTVLPAEGPAYVKALKWEGTWQVWGERAAAFGYLNHINNVGFYPVFCGSHWYSWSIWMTWDCIFKRSLRLHSGK